MPLWFVRIFSPATDLTLRKTTPPFRSPCFYFFTKHSGSRRKHLENAEIRTILISHQLWGNHTDFGMHKNLLK